MTKKEKRKKEGILKYQTFDGMSTRVLSLIQTECFRFVLIPTYLSWKTELCVWNGCMEFEREKKVQSQTDNQMIG